MILFEKVRGQIQQLHEEISTLLKSKPDNPINKFKLTFINEKLDQANTILTGEFKPFKEFTVFDEVALPSNSDVVLILGQYLDCFEEWRCVNIRKDAIFWIWNLGDGPKKVVKSPEKCYKYHGH